LGGARNRFPFFISMKMARPQEAVSPVVTSAVVTLMCSVLFWSSLVFSLSRRILGSCFAAARLLTPPPSPATHPGVWEAKVVSTFQSGVFLRIFRRIRRRHDEVFLDYYLNIEHSDCN